MLDQTAIVELVHDTLLPEFLAEKDNLDRIDAWYRWEQEKIQVPKGASQELRRLAELSKTPWLNLVVTNVAQAMYVDGYRSPDKSDNGSAWRLWQANDLDSRQVAIHRAALAYGISYATVLPGVNAVGESMSAIRGVSPRRMFAVYADPAEDDWPMYAIRAESQKGSWAIRVYDEEGIYFLTADTSGGKVDYIEDRTHSAGVCPVVRYCNMLDLEGRSAGEVEPFIPVAARINKTDFDRMMTQHFASWKVRTVAGMTQPSTDEESTQEKLRLRQDDLLVAEDPDTKFGVLDETPLEGFIKAHESDVETLAAVSQTPSHNLTGKMVNLSAEALAAARASLTQKGTERQKSFGKSHDQALRLGSYLSGDSVAAADVMAHVTWQDMEIRSISQAVDALGKAAQMLGVPPEALWPRIPGVTKLDVDEWKKLRNQGDPLSVLNATIERQTDAVGV